MRFLHMYFSNDAGRRVRITVRNAREDVTADEVSQVMDLLISKDIFSPSVGTGWALDTIFKPRITAPQPVRAAPEGGWVQKLWPLLVLLG
ncbi:MAG: DUF2922 domain-containing protein, partial [Synergistetes bacterium]|nr:DUF2922 domain-containing protein [Synergistota bacterium]